MRYALSALAIAIPASACATVQIPDDIVIDGQSGPLYGQVPTVPYMDPVISPRASSAAQADAAAERDAVLKRLAPYAVRETCSASWRGYQAYWEIREDKLFLVGLVFAPCHSRMHVPITALLPDAVDGAFAAWASGKLFAAIGPFSRDLGSGGRFEAYWEIQVNRGVVTSRTRVDKPFSPFGMR